MCIEKLHVVGASPDTCMSAVASSSWGSHPVDVQVSGGYVWLLLGLQILINLIAINGKACTRTWERLGLCVCCAFLPAELLLPVLPVPDTYASPAMAVGRSLDA